MNKLDIFSSNKSANLLLISFILQFAIYIVPVGPTSSLALRPLVFFLSVYLYLVILTFLLLRVETNTGERKYPWLRHIVSFGIMTGSYLLYLHVIFSYVFREPMQFLSQELANFLSSWIMCILIGFSYRSIYRRNQKEKEVESLKLESLQSRCEALTNQINPHFFFNLLNGLAVLIRNNNRDESIEYLEEMSDVFRYILQINKETLITLEEELRFLNSYRYLLEIRYRDKLSFEIDIPREMMHCKLPTLSLLPLVENVVKHNMIDSHHKMVVSIKATDEGILMVSNDMYDKLIPVASNKIGLSNLATRFKLLVDKNIQVVVKNGRFNVLLPLISYQI